MIPDTDLMPIVVLDSSTLRASSCVCLEGNKSTPFAIDSWYALPRAVTIVYQYDMVVL